MAEGEASGKGDGVETGVGTGLGVGIVVGVAVGAVVEITIGFLGKTSRLLASATVKTRVDLLYFPIAKILLPT